MSTRHSFSGAPSVGQFDERIPELEPEARLRMNQLFADFWMSFPDEENYHTLSDAFWAMILSYAALDYAIVEILCYNDVLIWKRYHRRGTM
jgi:hypothetical protein